MLGEVTGEQGPSLFCLFPSTNTPPPTPASPFCAKQPLKPLPSWLSLGCSFRTDDAPHRMPCFPLPPLCPSPLKSFRPPRIPSDGREQERGKAEGEGLEPPQSTGIRGSPGTGARVFPSSVPHRCFLTTGRGKKEGASPRISRRPQLPGDGMDQTLGQQLGHLPLGPVTGQRPPSAKSRD